MTWDERWHPLREQWVIVAARRQERPWEGEIVGQAPLALPRCLPDCYFCRGNRRLSSQLNDRYQGVFAFDDDHPCASNDAPRELEAPVPFFKVRPANGSARVVCYGPRHDLTLAELDEQEISTLLRSWQAEYVDLGARPDVRSVLTFEKGEVVGVSNPHPHRQIHANNFVWPTLEVELAAAERYLAETGRVLFRDVIRAEHEDGRRVLYEDDRVLREPNLLEYLAELEIGRGAFLSDTALEARAAELRALSTHHCRASS